MKQFDDVFMLEMIGSGRDQTEHGTVIGYLEDYNDIVSCEKNEMQRWIYQGRPVVPVVDPATNHGPAIIVAHSNYTRTRDYIPKGAVYVHCFFFKRTHPQQQRVYEYFYFNKYGWPVAEFEWPASFWKTIEAYWQRFSRKVLKK